MAVKPKKPDPLNRRLAPGNRRTVVHHLERYEFVLIKHFSVIIIQSIDASNSIAEPYTSIGYNLTSMNIMS